MTETIDPIADFWNVFASHMASARTSLLEQVRFKPQGVPASEVTKAIKPLEAYRRLVPGGSLHFSAGEGSGQLQVWLFGGYQRANLEKIAGLMSAAPAMAGWQIEAFERRGPLADVCHFLNHEVATSRLRFSYKISNNRIGFIILSDGLRLDDYSAGREFARGIVAAMIGEIDFCLHVSDAQLIDYETWLAIVPGGQSYALCELPGIFDPIFTRPLIENPDVDQTGDVRGSLIAA